MTQFAAWGVDFVTADEVTVAGTTRDVHQGVRHVTAMVLSLSPTAGQLRIVVPPHAEGTGHVVVTTPGGLSATGPATQYSWMKRL